MVAVGSLDRVWLLVQEDITAEELSDSFRSYFGAEWDDVLNSTEKSFAYNATNDAYFAVRNVRTLENLTLEQLLERKAISQAPNIIVS